MRSTMASVSVIPHNTALCWAPAPPAARPGNPRGCAQWGGSLGRNGGMTDGGAGAPRRVLGPLLRYVGETAVTIWVETDRACQVEILGHQMRTFEVAGHHYGLVVVGGLRPGAEREYQVALDGTVRWPEPDSPFPPSVLRTLDS